MNVAIQQIVYYCNADFQLSLGLHGCFIKFYKMLDACTLHSFAVSRCDNRYEHVYTNKHFPPGLHHKRCSFQDEIRNKSVCFIVPKCCY